MDVQIKAMAYSPVSPSLENSNQWQELMGESDSVESEVFERYVQEIILKKDITDVTRGEFVNPDTDPQGWLDNVLEANFESGQDTFESASKNLAEELNSNIHGNSKDGVLFCVQGLVSGEGLADNDTHRIVSLLKLDLIEEERLQLDDDRSLKELDLNDIFPEPKELQKGMIYPIVPSNGFRLPGDVKFYQNGTVSDYFHDFLECQVVESSLEQAKDVFSVIDALKEDYTGESANGDDLHRFRELKEETNSGLVGIGDVVDIARDIVGRDVSQEEIASRLDIDNPQSLAIDTKEMPSYVKYEVDHEIEVKFPSSAEERVQKEESSNGVEVRISGADISTQILDR